MTLTKQQRKRIAVQAIRDKAQSRIGQCVLATGSLDSAKTRLPGSDIYGKAELGNWSLEILPGESMAIFDRSLFRHRKRLAAENSVVLDEFGGDFFAECYERDQSLLVIPIGHQRQDLWPTSHRMKPTFSVGTDEGSLAFLRTSQIPESLSDDGTVWNCLPGRYSFYYEEIIDLGPSRQPLARNVVVSRVSEAASGATVDANSKKSFWSRITNGLRLLAAEHRAV